MIGSECTKSSSPHRNGESSFRIMKNEYDCKQSPVTSLDLTNQYLRLSDVYFLVMMIVKHSVGFCPLNHFHCSVVDFPHSPVTSPRNDYEENNFNRVQNVSANIDYGVDILPQSRNSEDNPEARIPRNQQVLFKHFGEQDFKLNRSGENQQLKELDLVHSEPIISWETLFIVC
jgi:hypothetical protein